MRQIALLTLALTMLASAGCIVATDDEELLLAGRGPADVFVVEETVYESGGGFALWDLFFDDGYYYEEEIVYEEPYFEEVYYEDELYYFEEHDYYSSTNYNPYDDPFYYDPLLDPFYLDGFWLDEEFDDFAADDDYFFGWP